MYMGHGNCPDLLPPTRFQPFTFPVHTAHVIRREFVASLQTVRDMDFCLFAKHDPNVRLAIGAYLRAYRSILAGPLFGQRVPSKLPVQRRCRYELITENEIGEAYASEKIGEALMAGCVPVYWGCRRIESLVPADLFVNLDDFTVDGQPDIAAAVAHCLMPGVYERYVAAIRERGLDVLLSRFTIEKALVDPLLGYIERLRAANFRNRRFDLVYRAWSARERVQGMKRVPGRQPASLRQALGTVVYDWPRFLGSVCSPSCRDRATAGWVRMRNRDDRLIPGERGRGVRCDWMHTRTLHLCDVSNTAGRLLLQRSLRDWPVRLADWPTAHGRWVAGSPDPDLTFLSGTGASTGCRFFSRRCDRSPGRRVPPSSASSLSRMSSRWCGTAYPRGSSMCSTPCAGQTSRTIAPAHSTVEWRRREVHGSFCTTTTLWCPRSTRPSTAAWPVGGMTF